MPPYVPPRTVVSVQTELRGRMGPSSPGYGGREGMSHLQYASYSTDRATRFYMRRRRRDGFYFGDPLLMLLLADSTCAWDDLPCPDQPPYP